MLEDLVREIHPEEIPERPKRIARATVLASERLVRRKVEDDALPAQLGLLRAPENIVFRVLEKAACGRGACVREEAAAEAVVMSTAKGSVCRKESKRTL